MLYTCVWEYLGGRCCVQLTTHRVEACNKHPVAFLDDVIDDGDLALVLPHQHHHLVNQQHTVGLQIKIPYGLQTCFRDVRVVKVIRGCT